MSIARAKVECEKKTKELLDNGSEKKQNFTFEELFIRYYNQHSKKHKKLHKIDLQYNNTYLKVFQKKPVNKITVNDITKFHAQLGEHNGKYIANRILALIRGVYNWGIKQQIIDSTNPASHIKPYKERSRDRFLDDEELRRFFNTLDTTPKINGLFRDYFKVLLFTGQRKSNVCAMAFSDIDWKNRQWYISGETFKNGDPFYAELIDFVVNILEKRKKELGKDAYYVFPSPASKSGHIVEPKKAWYILLKEAKLENLRMHDLRRTFGSWQAMEGGENLQVVGDTMGHKTTKATEVYARFKKSRRRTSAEKGTNAMLKVINQKDEKILNDIDQLKHIISSINTNSKEDFKKKVLEELLK